jgi:hypothetical protein
MGVSGSLPDLPDSTQLQRDSDWTFEVAGLSQLTSVPRPFTDQGRAVWARGWSLRCAAAEQKPAEQKDEVHSGTGKSLHIPKENHFEGSDAVLV